MVQNWWCYKCFWLLPFTETIGVYLSAKHELIGFLLSDESLKCYSNSVDMNAISNLFGLNIAVFTYGDSTSCQPGIGLLRIQHKSNMYGARTLWSKEVIPDVSDLWIYHANDSHFDRLVKREKAAPQVMSLLPMTTNNNNSLNFTGISMLDMPSILNNIDWDPDLHITWWQCWRQSLRS